MSGRFDQHHGMFHITVQSTYRNGSLTVTETVAVAVTVTVTVTLGLAIPAM